MKPDQQPVYPGDVFAGHPLDARLEDEVRNMRGDAAALYSIAISMKRIADYMHGDPERMGVLDSLANIADRMPRCGS